MRLPVRMLAIVAAMLVQLTAAVGIAEAQKPNRPGASDDAATEASIQATTLILRNRGSNKCLEVLYFSTANNAPAGQYTCDGASSQHWQYDGPSGLIRNVYSGKCLEVLYFSTANNAQVGQYTCDGAVSQRWILDQTIGVVYNTYTNKCLDILGGSTANNALAVQYDCQPYASQNWLVGYV